jgi:hypothetical protein
MQDTNTHRTRRTVLKAAGVTVLASALPGTLLAQGQAAAAERHFDPRPGDWKSFEVVTQVSLQRAEGPSMVWVPLPSLDTDWQRTLSNNWSGNAKSLKVGSDPKYGAKYLVAQFDGSAPPMLQGVSRIQTRARGRVGRRPAPVAASDRPDAAGRHRAQDRQPDRAGRPHRRRQGPAHL